MDSPDTRKTRTSKRRAIDAWYPPDSKDTSKKCKVALASLSLKKLPKILYPSKDRDFNPPVFHFGYLFNTQWLLKFAEDHDLLAYLNDSFQNEPYLCEELTTEDVMEYITEKAGVISFKLTYDLIAHSPGVPFGSTVMSLAIASNYRRLDVDVDEVRPSSEDILKLQKYLGRADSPLWYLDPSSRCDGWGFRRWSFRE